MKDLNQLKHIAKMAKIAHDQSDEKIKQWESWSTNEKNNRSVLFEASQKADAKYKQEKEKQDKLTPDDIQKQNTKYHYFFEDEKDEK